LSLPVSKRDTLISKLANKVTLPELTSECIGTLYGGIIDLSNMLPFGCFSVGRDETLQDNLFVELRSIWEDVDEIMPSYYQLKQLPVLVSNPIAPGRMNTHFIS
jgi:hypothetical protein